MKKEWLENVGFSIINPCPNCRIEMIVKLDVFYYKGRFFSGLVCEKCNALYDNPKDSFKICLNLT